MHTPIGIQFWKVGSRKIFAVRESDLRPNRPRKNTISLDSDSSDDMFLPLSKRGKCVSGKQLSESDQLLTEMQGLRKEIGQLFEVNKGLPIPIGLKRIICDTFRCCICQCTMVPPVIFGRCCKSLIGCQSCTDQWFRGETGLMQQACPKCRAERAYAETCVFKGIDDFLLAIHPLVQLDTETSGALDEEDN